ncbi:MAG: amylo-alpha-1,6-glucosidase [Planctomycetota bacterium]
MTNGAASLPSSNDKQRNGASAKQISAPASAPDTPPRVTDAPAANEARVLVTTPTADDAKLPVSTLADEAQFIVEFRGGIDRLRRLEWLLTDGLGGFAMGTALGLNTRRYHGHYVYANKPPVDRVMGLNAVHEQFILDPGSDVEQTFDLTTLEFSPRVLTPRGFESLVRFEKGTEFVRWVYRFGDFEVTKTLRVGFRRSMTEVHYSIEGPDIPAQIKLRPMVRMHDYHHLIHCGFHNFRVRGTPLGIGITCSTGDLHLATDRGEFHSESDWWLNFHLEEERLRGQDHLEDLFTPGVWTCVFDRSDRQREITLRAATHLDELNRPLNPGERSQHLLDIRRWMKQRTPRLAEERVLIAASDDFVVPRSVEGAELMTIMAGYPWFSDWGRDTMISLPGLLLVSGRFEAAFSTLRAYAANRRHGLVPNRFDDYGEAAHYNTVDASLWYCHAACEYRRVSGDNDGFSRELLPACLDVIQHYREGTDFNIRMDPADYLIAAGTPDTQLTWMDAKRNGIAFTPRHGKPVEINALWYHALRSIAEALRETGAGDPKIAAELDQLADRVAESFPKTFWIGGRKYLADCIVPRADASHVGEAIDHPEAWVADESVRPNQLFAVSLRHSALSIEQQKAIVQRAEDELLTPMGIRTLSPSDPKYRGRFDGDMFSRDSAYHQGTVWPWLMGPFIEAYLRANQFDDASKMHARQWLNRFLKELKEPRWGSLGQLFEVYDGDHSDRNPQHPGGTMAQAWSVAELMRCLALIETGGEVAGR